MARVARNDVLLKLVLPVARVLVLITTLVVASAQGSGSGTDIGRKLTLRGYSHVKFNATDSTQKTLVPGADGSKIGFGAMTHYDVPFKLGNTSSSAVLGHVRGFGSFTNADNPLDNASLFLTFFIQHRSANCTLIVHGTSTRTDAVKPFVIVGGSGPFDLARGTVLQHTASQTIDSSSGAILIVNEWNFNFYQEDSEDSVAMDLQKLEKLFPDMVSQA